MADKDHLVAELSNQNFDLKHQLDTLRDKLTLSDNQRQMLQSQVKRKTKDFDELRQQFEYLRK